MASETVIAMDRLFTDLGLQRGAAGRPVASPRFARGEPWRCERPRSVISFWMLPLWFDAAVSDQRVECRQDLTLVALEETMRMIS